MVRPQMGHASLAVFAKPRSLVPEGTALANCRLCIGAGDESLHLHVYFPDFYREPGRGVS